MSSMQPGPAHPGPSAAPGGAPRPQSPAGARPAPRTDDQLGRLDGLPLAEHADVFARLHAELQAALAEIDS